MTAVLNDELQAMRHVAANARNKGEVRGSPLLCDGVLELLQGLRVAAIHARLEVVPELFDGIEVRTPRRPVDQVHAVVVEPLTARGCCMHRPVVLLEPPLSTRPEEM